MSLYNFTPSPAPSWATNWAGITPTASPLNLGASGLGSLPGAEGGILARGLGGGLSSIAPRIPFGQTLASQVPRGAGAEALAAANALRGGGQAAAGGLASRLPSLGGLLQGGSVAARPMLGGLGFGLAGTVGSSLVDKLNPGGQNSNLEQGLQGAATGAGIGAGLGLAGGPFAPLTSSAGAAIGGVLGGAIGVLGNMFGGGGDGESDAESDPVSILGNAINMANIPPDITEQILTTYEVSMALAEAQEDDGLREQLQAQAFEQAGQMVLAAIGQREQAQSSASNMLGLQSQAADIFDPLARDIETSGMLYADAMRGIRDDLPESYRAIADATTARELSSSQKLAAAYKAQAAITPVVNQLAQYQQDYNSFAAQQFAQALAQQAAGSPMTTGGSTADVAAMLAPQ